MSLSLSAPSVQKPESRCMLVDFLPTVYSLGFQEMFELVFEGKDAEEERYFVFFHPGLGVLLEFHTRGEDTIGEGRFYYNWHSDRKKSAVRMHGIVGHGAWMDGERSVHVGYHSIPDKNLRPTLDIMQVYGMFLCPWEYAQVPNLTHFGDLVPGRGIVKPSGSSHDMDAYDSLLKERLLMLPFKVRRALLLPDL